MTSTAKQLPRLGPAGSDGVAHRDYDSSMPPGNTGEGYVQKINFKHLSELRGWITKAMLGSTLKIRKNLLKGCSKSFPDRLRPLGSGQGSPLLQCGA